MKKLFKSTWEIYFYCHVYVKADQPKISLLSWTHFNKVMQNTMNNDEGQVMWEIKIFKVGLDMILFS